MRNTRRAAAAGLAFVVVALTGRACPVAEAPGPGAFPDHPPLGFVDVVRTADSDDVLEQLVADERYVDAFARAVSTYRRQLDTHGPDALDTLSALRRVGVVAHLAGDQRLAARVLGATAAALRRAPGAQHAALAETLIRHGYAARYLGERTQALALYDEARALLDGDDAGRAPLRGFLEQAMADWVRATDRKQSIQRYERALELRRSAPEVSWFWIADNETWTAWTLAREGRWEQAIAHVEEARRIFDSIGVHDQMLLATLDDLAAQDLDLRGRHPEAIAIYARAAEQAERSRRRHAPGVPRSTITTTGFNALAGDAIQHGQGEQAWSFRERGLGAVHAESAILGRGIRRDPAALAARETLSRRLLAATKEWELGETSAATLARMLEDRAQLDAMRAAQLEADPVPVPDLRRVQKLLDARTAMIGWLELHLGDLPTDTTQPQISTGWGFVVRPGRDVQWVQLWSTRGKAGWLEISRFRTGMKRLLRASSWPERVAGDPEMHAALAERGRRYFDPLRPYLAGVERLIVDGDLHMIPEVFVGSDGRYVADEFEIVHVPSSATFEILSGTASPAPAAAESILAIAAGPSATIRFEPEDLLPGVSDPVTTRSARSAFPRHDARIDDLPPLPFATVETASISRAFRRAVRLEGTTGIDARLDALVASGEMETFDVIHIAGHALSDPAPERGAIVIATREPSAGSRTDGILTVEDITLSWRLAARLVTLSACESATAGGGSIHGEPLGFPPALLGAGAETVLSSHWPVDDRATSILMRRFYENLTGRGAPMSAARSLAEARAYLRGLHDPSGVRPFEHPIYWAGWTLMGTGR